MNGKESPERSQEAEELEWTKPPRPTDGREDSLMSHETLKAYLHLYIYHTAADDGWVKLTNQKGMQFFIEYVV